MKVSWGTGITITIVIFMAAVISLVIYAHTLDVNLVADNYYEQEIKHQSMIDKKMRAQKLSKQIKTVIEGDNIVVTFPDLFKYYEIGGTISLYRPSDRREDLLWNIDLNTELVQRIPSGTLSPGLWRLKVDWTARDSAYFNEKIIMIN